MVARGVGVHQPLEGEEPHPVRLSLAENGDGFPPVQTFDDACLRADFPDAVHGPGIEPGEAVRLRL